MCKCNYIKPESIIVNHMIDLIYYLLEERTGGLAHIVTDDNNIDDESLKSTIEWCNNESNKNRPDAFPTKVLCEAMLRLTYAQRCFLFGNLEAGEDDETFENMLQYECYFNGECSSACPFKRALNVFYAEQKCIRETGNNLDFLDNGWPIEDITEV